jgi:hypothetical protein
MDWLDKAEQAMVKEEEEDEDNMRMQQRSKKGGRIDDSSLGMTKVLMNDSGKGFRLNLTNKAQKPSLKQ